MSDEFIIRGIFHQSFIYISLSADSWAHLSVVALFQKPWWYFIRGYYYFRPVRSWLYMLYIVTNISTCMSLSLQKHWLPTIYKKICITIYNVGLTSKRLSRRCTNVIQMFCVCWVCILLHDYFDVFLCFKLRMNNIPKSLLVMCTSIYMWGVTLQRSVLAYSMQRMGNITHALVNVDKCLGYVRHCSHTLH